MLELVVCPDPECGLPASVHHHALLESTNGPVEHAKICCVGKHHFLMPVASLTPL